MSTIDRAVHATSKDGDEIVRYDKAGKWWLERADGTRASLKIGEAVEQAISFARAGGKIHTRRPGGKSFDVKVRRALA